jgi:hypothetical protein
VPFGMSSSNGYGCLGLCLDKLLICLLVGVLPKTLEVQLFGRWCLCASCGVFGGK